MWTVVAEATRFVNRTRPWAAAEADRDAALAALVAACRTLGDELEPFRAATAARVRRRCTPVDGRLPSPKRLSLVSTWQRMRRSG